MQAFGEVDNMIILKARNSGLNLGTSKESTPYIYFDIFHDLKKTSEILYKMCICARALISTSIAI